MKKILTLFAVVGLIAFTSCEGPEGPPGVPGTSANRVFELMNVDFGANSQDGFNISASYFNYVGYRSRSSSRRDGLFFW